MKPDTAQPYVDKCARCSMGSDSGVHHLPQWSGGHSYEAVSLSAKQQAIDLVNKALGKAAPVETYEPTEATALSDALYDLAEQGHDMRNCTKPGCKWCDPMERYVDGLTVRECLSRYEQMQRGDGSPPWLTWKGAPIGPTGPVLTAAQKDAARLAWSAELRAKVQQAEEKRRVEVACDDDRWEP